MATAGFQNGSEGSRISNFFPASIWPFPRAHGPCYPSTTEHSTFVIRTRNHRLGCQGTILPPYYSLPSSSSVYTFLKEGTAQHRTFLLLVVSVWCRETMEMVEDGEGTVHSPCLDSTETGMPGSLSLMNGPISLSMPSRARRRFLVHTFPWTRSLSSCRIKEVHVFLSSLPTPSVSNPGPTDQLSPVQPQQTPTAWPTHDTLFDVYISSVS